MSIIVRSKEDLHSHLEGLSRAATHAQEWVKQQDCPPAETLLRMKFEKIGVHPIGGHPLNLIEQVNQTCTYAVAFAAVKLLLEWHPNVGGFHIAPGAEMSIPLDIMSVEDGLVGAETFAAVDPRNNSKIRKDLNKLAARPESHRYVFFASPLHRLPSRLPRYEVEGVQVWSVDIWQPWNS